LAGVEWGAVEAEGESGMELVGGKVVGRTWEGLSELLDYGNDARKQLPGSSGVEDDDWELMLPVAGEDQGWGDGQPEGTDESGSEESDESDESSTGEP
jgi:hypothetical protein